MLCAPGLDEKLASLMMASWNQLVEWLKQIGTLREYVQTAKKPA